MSHEPDLPANDGTDDDTGVLDRAGEVSGDAAVDSDHSDLGDDLQLDSNRDVAEDIVTCEGVICGTSEREPNWQNPDYNNFRQNVQGDLDPTLLPDLTANTRELVAECDGDGNLELTVLICNRGLKTVGAGVPIRFYDGVPPESPVVCETTTPALISPDRCVEVTCEWTEVPLDMAHTVYVVADDWEGEDGLVECYENNNTAIVEVICSSI